MIEEISLALGGVSEGVVYALLVFGAIQLVVQVWALIDLARINAVAGGRKWVWALIIIFLSNMALGAILYIAIGRRVPQTVAEEARPAAPQADRATKAVDSLYGSEDGAE